MQEVGLKSEGSCISRFRKDFCFSRLRNYNRAPTDPLQSTHSSPLAARLPAPSPLSGRRSALPHTSPLCQVTLESDPVPGCCIPSPRSRHCPSIQCHGGAGQGSRHTWALSTQMRQAVPPCLCVTGSPKQGQVAGGHRRPPPPCHPSLAVS